MDWANLSSGLFSAPIAAGAALSMYWHGAFSSAKVKLLAELEVARHRVLYDWPDGVSAEARHECLRGLWGHYLGYREWVFWRRSRLETAWARFRERFEPGPGQSVGLADREDLHASISALIGEI